MARISGAKALSTKAALTSAYAGSFLKHGLQGASISRVMRDIGLTHGGFYSHYGSKDLLTAAACQFAFDRQTSRWKQLLASKRNGGSRRVVLAKAYLESQLGPEPGDCPIAALAMDVARERADARVRGVYASGLAELVDLFVGEGAASTDRQAATADFCMLVGAATLVRATAGAGISGEIVAAIRARLLPSSDARSPSAGKLPEVA